MNERGELSVSLQRRKGMYWRFPWESVMCSPVSIVRLRHVTGTTSPFV